MKRKMFQIFIIAVLAFGGAACSTSSDLEEVVVNSPESTTDDKDVEKEKPGGD